MELNAGRLVKFSKKFVAVGEFGQMREEFGNGRELVEFMKSEVTGFVREISACSGCGLESDLTQGMCSLCEV